MFRKDLSLISMARILMHKYDCRKIQFHAPPNKKRLKPEETNGLKRKLILQSHKQKMKEGRKTATADHQSSFRIKLAEKL